VGDNGEPETVYELIPSFSVERDGPRLTANASAHAELYQYSGLNDSHVYSFFDGALSAALDPDHFFVDLGGYRKQTIVDPQGRVPQGNLPISANLVDTDIYYYGPRFLYGLGNDILARGNFRASHTSYGQPVFGFEEAQDFDDDTVDFSIDNLKRQRGFTWSVDYQSDKTSYVSFPAYEHRQATLELGAWATKGLRFFAAGGKESAWDKLFDPTLADPFWEAGVSLQEHGRIKMELAAGERSFGKSRRADLGLTFKHGSTNFSYVEQPQTQSVDPRTYGKQLTPDDLTDYLTRVTSPERYLSKHSEWDTNLTFGRTDVTVYVFDEKRGSIVRLDGVPLPSENQTGASFTVSRRVGAKLHASVSSRFARRDFGDGNPRDLRTTSLMAGYDLGPRTRVSLEIARNTEDSNGVDPAFDYTENRATVLLTRTF
jgi:hypothetical protein